jgi:hypothetical protein
MCDFGKHASDHEGSHLPSHSQMMRKRAALLSKPSKSRLTRLPSLPPGRVLGSGGEWRPGETAAPAHALWDRLAYTSTESPFRSCALRAVAPEPSRLVPPRREPQGAAGAGRGRHAGHPGAASGARGRTGRDAARAIGRRGLRCEEPQVRRGGRGGACPLGVHVHGLGD